MQTHLSARFAGPSCSTAECPRSLLCLQFTAAVTRLSRVPWALMQIGDLFVWVQKRRVASAWLAAVSWRGVGSGSWERGC